MTSQETYHGKPCARCGGTLRSRHRAECVSCKNRGHGGGRGSRAAGYRRSGARKRGIEWGLSNEQVADLLERAEGTPCPACGQWMATRTKHAPSLDRLLNHRGYTPDNVAVVCAPCNRTKSTYTGEQLYRLAQYVLAMEARARY